MHLIAAFPIAAESAVHAMQFVWVVVRINVMQLVWVYQRHTGGMLRAAPSKIP